VLHLCQWLLKYFPFQLVPFVQLHQAHQLRQLRLWLRLVQLLLLDCLQAPKLLWHPWHLTQWLLGLQLHQ